MRRDRICLNVRVFFTSQAGPTKKGGLKAKVPSIALPRPDALGLIES